MKFSKTISFTFTKWLDSERFKKLVPGMIVILLNVLICKTLFFTEYLNRLDSIEGTHVAVARWMQEHPFGCEWFPQWYGGIPMQNAYPPLLHVLVACFASLTGVVTAHAHHIVSASLYCLGPAALYALALRLSGDRWSAFFGALLWSLISFSGFIISEVGKDMGTQFGLRRLHAMVLYGEGPHIASITFLPIALLALDWALKTRKPLSVASAAIMLAIVVLTNWLGGLALAAMVVAYLISFPGTKPIQCCCSAAGIGVLAYLLASPWIPPSTISLIGHHEQNLHGDYQFSLIHLMYLGLTLATLGLICTACRWKQVSPTVQFSMLFTFTMATPTLAWSWAGTHTLPQPSRYHLEMDFGLCLLSGFVLTNILRRLTTGYTRTAVVIMVVLGVAQAYNGKKFADSIINSVDVRETMQFKVARWCDENLSGKRVYAGGSVRFWMNAFGDSPHLGGGFDQGMVNTHLPHVIYGVQSQPDDGPRAVAWLKAYGVSALVVSDAGSVEPYKDFVDPHKFDGILNEIWTNGSDTIYELPLSHDPLARLVPLTAVVEELRDNYLSNEDVVDFVEAAANVPMASVTWLNSDQATIKADVPSGHVLSLAISYHHGWHAVIDGEPVEIRRDALGLMIIEPMQPGPATISINFNGGTEMRVAKAVRGIAIAFLFGWWIVATLRGRFQARKVLAASKA